MAGILIFAATFTVYAVTASPAMGWLDSPEFVASAASLGVAHSPGHPLTALLGRLATLLPAGDLTFRVNLMSAVFAAAAATALYHAGRHLLALVVPEIIAPARRAAATAGALVFGFSAAAWFQGGHAEVYALQAFLVIGALAALLGYARYHAPQRLAMAGLFGGLALANHHLIAILFLIPAALWILASRRLRPDRRLASATALLGLLGVAALLYLPVRAVRHPEVNWGAPFTVDRFAWTVSARAFHKSVAAERPSPPAADAAHLAASLVDNATPPLALAALFALYLGLRRRDQRGLFGFLLAVVAIAAVGRVLIGFDPEVPDHHAYLLPAIAVFILLGVVGATAALRGLSTTDPMIRRRAAWGVVGLLCVLPPWQLYANATTCALGDARASDELARWELEGLPPRAVLLISYFETSYRVWALHATEQARPDVTILDLGFLTYPGAAEESARRYPDLAGVIAAPLALTARLPVDRLRGLAPRSVWIQLQPELDPAAWPALLPEGPFARLAPTAPTTAERARATAADLAARQDLSQRFGAPAASDRIGVRNALLWHDFNRLRFHCLTDPTTPWQLAADSLLTKDCELVRLPGDGPARRDRGAGAAPR